MTFTIGALFAGYGGLDLAVQMALPARLAWFSELEAAPARILAHQFPHVPNHGDVTAIDWRDVEPVDIITGGSPCQDLSHAGKRAGMTPGTRSGLWASMCEAIETIRPRLVVWENVQGALSAKATIGNMEQCDLCMDNTGGGNMRALGRVLGDLAEIGYNAAWTSLRAGDVGAPHGRLRVFVLAWPTADTDNSGRETFGLTSRSSQKNPEPARHISLLPTPTVNDRGASYDPASWDAWTARMKAKHGNGNGHGKSLSIEALRQRETWGDYAPAITRWEAVSGRPAPAPTLPTGKDGQHQLSAQFVEWMMGLPAGWVTDTAIGISRNQQLKALGNGVVPQQAAWAIRHLLGIRQLAADECSRK